MEKMSFKSGAKYNTKWKEMELGGKVIKLAETAISKGIFRAKMHRISIIIFYR